MVKKKTHDEFIEQVMSKSDGSIKVITEYQGSKQKIEFYHYSCGHKWWREPNRFLRYPKCPNCHNPNKKVTKEELKSQILDFFQTNDRLPIAHEIRSYRATYNYFNNWDEALLYSGLDLDYDIKKRKDVIKKEIISFYKKFNKVPTSRDTKKRCHFTYTEMTIRDYFGGFREALEESGVFQYVKNNSLFFREPLDKDKVLKTLLRKSKEKGRMLTCKEIDSDQNLPHSSAVRNLLGNINAIAIENGLKPNHVVVEYNEKDVIDWVKKFYKNNNRVPNCIDFDESDEVPAFNTIQNYITSLYELYDMAKIEKYKRRSKSLSDQEIIDEWYKIRNKLKRTPIISELITDKGENIYSAIYWRWGEYINFLKELNEEDGYASPITNKKFITKGGTQCLSGYEFAITSFLEDYNVPFNKETPYKQVIKSDNSKRRFDWEIATPNKNIYIEMFGMGKRFGYSEKVRSKINDCVKNGITLISLYPEDINEKLDDTLKSILSYFGILDYNYDASKVEKYIESNHKEDESA